MIQMTAAPRHIGADTIRGDRRRLVILSMAFLLTVVIRAAWIADDAAIDLRVVENFVSGHGLRWNVAERVQSFTDPLWVLAVSAIDAFVRQPYIAVWVLSLVLTIAAVWIVAFAVAADTAAALLAIATLTFSKAFVEYSCAGFQTPLTVTLVAAFWALYWRMRPDGRRLSALTLCAALCALTDVFAVVLLIPATIVAAARVDPGARLRALGRGGAPLFAWLLVVAVYYGFLLPNPAIAWWHSSWRLADLVRQGGLYVLDSINSDPVAVATIAAAIAAAAAGMVEGGGAPAAGMLAFIAVLVVTGGDALSGRSLVPPFFSAVMLAARYPWQELGESVALPLGAVVALGLVATPGSPVLTGADFGATIPTWQRWPGDPAPKPTEVNGIRDERRLSYPTTGLLLAQRYVPLPDTSAAEVAVNTAGAGRYVLEADAVGILGVVAGPTRHVIDRLARADAFLARVSPREAWRPGGVRREIPAGYVESLETQQNRLERPALAAYYDELAIVTRGPLFSRERLRAAIDLNLRRAPRCCQHRTGN
jgi:arabinofuranosyltransferase